MPTPNPLRLGFIGLDTSHVEALIRIWNDPAHPHHLPGARVVAGFSGGSPDFPLSVDRVDGYTRLLRDSFAVRILDSPGDVAREVDALLITAADGRAHAALFEDVASTRKPVFIDKPFATTSAVARGIASLAASQSTPLCSSSTLRYEPSLVEALGDDTSGAITGAEFSGPLPLQPTQPGFFWYGIHTAEMLYATLGPGCVRLRTAVTADCETVTGVWTDGRIGVIRGHLTGNAVFEGTVRRERGTQSIAPGGGPPREVGLARALMTFFRGGQPAAPMTETLELIRFLEAANESRRDQREIAL